ncbi:regulator of G-protein signaling [Acrasis kona]|uniref:Regulator of G-protein signaling n=1 Tax=Acrasis kona TaxID=1008807 RepID=A0AAW2YWS7_9EUKA
MQTAVTDADVVRVKKCSSKRMESYLVGLLRYYMGRLIKSMSFLSKSKGGNNCFMGHEAVTALSSIIFCTRAHAEAIGQWLQSQNYINHICNALPFYDDETLYYVVPSEDRYDTFVDSQIVTVHYKDYPSDEGSVDEITLNHDVLPDTPYHEMFKAFCIKDMSEELIEFWEDVHTCRREKDEDQRKQMAEGIYNKYINQSGEKPLNLKSSMVQKFDKSSLGSYDSFDEVEEFVEKDMEDILSRFKIQEQEEIARREFLQKRKSAEFPTGLTKKLPLLSSRESSLRLRLSTAKNFVKNKVAISNSPYVSPSTSPRSSSSSPTTPSQPTTTETLYTNWQKHKSEEDLQALADLCKNYQKHENIYEVLADPRLCRSFRAFCLKEHSSELVDFYLEVQKYKETKYKGPKVAAASSMQYRYLDRVSQSYVSPFEQKFPSNKVSVSDKLFDELNKNINSGRDDIFDDILKDVMSSIMEKHTRWLERLHN